MDDTGCRGFFLEPVATYHRQYEALRAFFIEGRCLHDIAQQFGYRRPRYARWSVGFVPKCKLARSPLFCATAAGATPAAASSPYPSRPRDDSRRRCARLEPGSGTSPAHARRGGVSLPALLARVHFEHLVSQASYPGSTMVPATSALLSLLVLKLLDKERRSHINDFNFDEAVGLFAGLNVPPKKSYATDYSYRTVRDHQQKLLSGWIGAVAPVLFPQANTFSLDFHPIPFRGDATGLDQHYLPKRGKAGTSVLSFFAQEHESQVVCYANANLTRRDQTGEALQFVEFWQDLTGVHPQWLYFDSKVVPYPELAQLNHAASGLSPSGGVAPPSCAA